MQSVFEIIAEPSRRAILGLLLLSQQSAGEIQRQLRMPQPAVSKHLRDWAPFDADGSLGSAGTTVKLTTVGATVPHVSETTVKRADAPRLLEFTWGNFDMRSELEPFAGGTRLTLWANIGRRFISMGAAGWHICFNVRDHLLGGTPIDRIVGPDAVKFGGWQPLNAEYARQFGVETPNWPLQSSERP
jgi:hypothetical protein